MGLTQVIRRLAIPKEQEPLPLVLIHAMAPALNVAGRNEDLGIFRKTAYDILALACIACLIINKSRLNCFNNKAYRRL
ncbi:MAG: hypothetical protein HEQ35_07695 [Gloeotrichia echinulata IR180]